MTGSVRTTTDRTYTLNSITYLTWFSQWGGLSIQLINVGWLVQSGLRQSGIVDRTYMTNRIIIVIID